MRVVSMLAVVAVAGCGVGSNEAFRVEAPLDEGAVGSIFQLDATVQPREARRVSVAGEGVEWSVSDPSVATLLPGAQLKLRAPGTVTVTARYRDEVRTRRLLAGALQALATRPRWSRGALAAASALPLLTDRLATLAAGRERRA